MRRQIKKQVKKIATKRGKALLAGLLIGLATDVAEHLIRLALEKRGGKIARALRRRR